MLLPSCRRALLAGMVDLEVDDGGNIEASDKEAGGGGGEGEPVVGVAGEKEAVRAARREVGEELSVVSGNRGVD